MKLFFKYQKYYSVTAMLLELGIPNFNTLLYNSRMTFANQVQHTNNSIIAQLRADFLICICVCNVCIIFLTVLVALVVSSVSSVLLSISDMGLFPK